MQTLLTQILSLHSPIYIYIGRNDSFADILYLLLQGMTSAVITAYLQVVHLALTPTTHSYIHKTCRLPADVSRVENRVSSTTVRPIIYP
jgi:hypothetical protein